MKEIYFKALQRKTKFRNPNHWLSVPSGLPFQDRELQEARDYIEKIKTRGHQFTYPGHQNYPSSFLKMKEPPLFLEYKGSPLWLQAPAISVVGSRDCSTLTRSWMNSQLSEFLKKSRIGVISGGARGVDQQAHLLALRLKLPSIFVLPSGLGEVYPENLRDFQLEEFVGQACFLTEFEFQQKIHKSHFYFRNRLISALGEMTLVVQASLKSGSMLTVHHCLENGKAVAVVPSHPEVLGFDGNLKLIREGAFPVMSYQDLLDFWNGEFHSKQDFIKGV